MPIESFLTLADQVGDPVGKLVILSNTGRCGSTLLTQVFEDLPHTVTLSEPEVLMAFTHEQTFDSETPQRRAELLKVHNIFYVFIKLSTGNAFLTFLSVIKFC